MDLHKIAAEIASEALVPNPFPSSKVSYLVYHGSRARGVTKFRRPPEGVWFAGTKGWVDDLYIGRQQQGEVRTCWIDVRNPYTPTDDEMDEYYGEMSKIGKFFDSLRAQGYDAYFQGGESDSIAVLDGDIVDAVTGNHL